MTATCYTQGRDTSKLWCVNLVMALASLLMLVPGVVSAAPPAQEDQEGQSYTVQNDDTLWSIAEKYLGKGSAYTTIAAATNAKHERDATFARIDNPNVIKLGWKLFIPSAEEAIKFERLTPETPTPTPETPMPTPATPTPTPETPVPAPATPTPTPTPEEVFPPVTPTNELTIPVDYFYVVTGLFVVIFALIGFALCRHRSLGALMGIFFAYVVADKSAKFIRDGLNFVLKLELGDEIIPYFQGLIFFLAVIGVVGCFLSIAYTHTFIERLKGMLIGGLTGYFVSIFALEFLHGILAGWLEDQTAAFDFSYNLLDWEGLIVLTLKFSSDPGGVYAVLQKTLVPTILVILWAILICSFRGFAKALGKILDAFLKWVSLRKKKEEKKEAGAT